MESQASYNLGQQIPHRQARSPFQYSTWTEQDSGVLPQPNNSHGTVAMVQSTMADDSMLSNYQQLQSWLAQTKTEQETQPSNVASVNQTSAWEPYVLGPFNFQNYQNDDPFGHNANQNAAEKGLTYTGPNGWPTLRSNALPYGANNAPYIVTMQSSTPSQSPLCDGFDYSSPTSIPTPDQAAPSGNWQSTPTLPSNAGLPQSNNDHSLTVTPELAALARITEKVANKAPLSVLRYSSSQDINPDRFQWRNAEDTQPTSNGYDLHYQSSLANGAQTSYTQSNVQPRASYTHGNANAQASSRQNAAQGQASSPQVDVQVSTSPTEGNFHVSTFHSVHNVQTQLPANREVLTLAEREYNDMILLEGKQRGETYKEIRNKLLGECPAESTLRGRYRSLTKTRGERVRKPVWTKVDTDLLEQFVQQELARVQSQVHNADTMNIQQKLARVSWKTVADSIKSSGGSYHFGVTTCKRKWMEINLPAGNVNQR